jgi:hypothetical protein
MEHWETVKAHNVHAFQREIDRDKPHARITNWQDIVKLYMLLRDTTEMKKELRI